MGSRSGIGLGLLIGVFILMYAALVGTAGAALRFDPSRTISDGGSVDAPEAVSDEAGTTSIAWASYTGGEPTLKFRAVAPDGEPGPVQVLATSTSLGESGIGPVGGQLGVAADGSATVVGLRFPHPANGGSEILAVRVGADGTPEPVQVLFAKAGWYAEEPQVAVDPDGKATVVWRSHQLAEVRLEAVQIAADGTIESIIPLASGGTDARVAMGSEGAATVVWSEAGGEHLDTVHIGADGTVGSLTHLPFSYDDPGQAALAVDSQGRATVVWRQGPTESGQVSVDRIAADGTPDEWRTVTNEPVGLFADPSVAVDGNGAWVTWSKQEGEVENFLWTVEAAWVDWSTPQESAFPLSGPTADHATIATGPSGHAWAAWSAKLGGESVIQFRRLTDGGEYGSTDQTTTLPATGPRSYSPTPLPSSGGGVNLVWREVGTAAQSVAYARGATVVPETSIDSATWPATSFTFGSPDFLIADFECDIEDRGFEPCSSPVSYGTVGPGLHTFEVRAVDDDGVIDPTPAVSSFEGPPIPGGSGEPPANGAAVPPVPLLPPGGRVEATRPGSHIEATHPPSAIATAAAAASVKSNRALLRVRCPARGSCRGTAALVGVGANHDTLLGRAHFALQPSGTAVLAFPLSRAARRLLAAGLLTAARLEGGGIAARRIRLT
jgi:hypothetical protein